MIDLGIVAALAALILIMGVIMYDTIFDVGTWGVSFMDYGCLVQYVTVTGPRNKAEELARAAYAEKCETAGLEMYQHMDRVEVLIVKRCE